MSYLMQFGELFQMSYILGGQTLAKPTHFSSRNPIFGRLKHFSLAELVKILPSYDTSNESPTRAVLISFSEQY